MHRRSWKYIRFGYFKNIRTGILNVVWFGHLNISSLRKQFEVQSTRLLYDMPLHKKCLYSEFFWSAFSVYLRIQPEHAKYGPEKLHFSRSAYYWHFQDISNKVVKHTLNLGLFPGEIAVTVFSLSLRKRSKVSSCAEGPKIQLGVLILKFRIKRNLLKL